MPKIYDKSQDLKGRNPPNQGSDLRGLSKSNHGSVDTIKKKI